MADVIDYQNPATEPRGRRSKRSAASLALFVADLILAGYIEYSRPMGALRRWDVLDPPRYYTLVALIEISVVLAAYGLFNALMSHRSIEPRWRWISGAALNALLLIWTCHRWLKPTCGWSMWEL